MLWVNLVMDTLAALALASEPPTEELLKRKPYGRKKPIISPGILKNVITQMIFQLGILLGLIWGSKYQILKILKTTFISNLFYSVSDWMLIDNVLAYSNIQTLNAPSQHFTVVFNAFIVMTLFNEINARKINGERNVFSGIYKNPFYYVIWIVCFAIQVANF